MFNWRTRVVLWRVKRDGEQGREEYLLGADRSKSTGDSLVSLADAFFAGHKT